MGLFSKWAESLDYEYEILKTCTRHQSPRSKCEKCLDSCDIDAILIVKGVPVINNEECIECGKCMAACPVQAVAGIFPKRTVIQNQLVITDDDIPTVMELLVYYKKGIRAIVCEQEKLNENLEKTIDEVNSVLQELGESAFSVIFQKGGGSTDTSCTRRDLFIGWKQETHSWMKQMTPAKWRFNQTDLELAKHYPNHQFSEIKLDISKCTLCRACQVLCDKNCLNVTETDFSISAQRCSSCRLCEDICPEKAIFVEEKISRHKTIEHPVYTKVCTSCNKSFETLSVNSETCVTCIKRKGFLVAR
ncbi:4Fe-4S dicluster domain-containing protein [Bacillus sp. V33-4]|uniref:4Fe-4S dicluster domain-containing protein n=1 Tax=Bacillus sp. V33-4 TaxID=2054169 RepID=UPI000C760B9D|nr:4Fe-4S dicluster domain-containing protein [Bacillus sp. V33-4]PLR84865.1 polyferredoxin [Bacillus sp. V33-4]